MAICLLCVLSDSLGTCERRLKYCDTQDIAQARTILLEKRKAVVRHSFILSKIDLIQLSQAVLRLERDKMLNDMGAAVF